jgi:chemotaxis protein MotA
MDMATVVGLVGAISLIIGGILTSPGASLGGFIDIPSIVMVFGGGTLTLFISLPFGRVMNIFRVFSKSIFVKSVDQRAMVGTLVDFAMTARRDGILALENKIDETTDPFVATGIRMAVDGTEPELIENLLMAEIESLNDRHKKGRQVCELFGKYAPAYGMIGTLVGLVIMLGNMKDPAAIGPGMAVAILTTLYGAVIANSIFLPVADKLAYYTREEMQARLLILQGVMAIQSGDNPRIVEQKLNVFLAPKDRAAES